MTRRCACCRMPAPLAAVYPGEVDGLGVVVGVCPRCEVANRRLPAGTRQKRLNSAAALAARDTSARFWTARLPDAGAAQLTAHLLAHPAHAAAAADAIGWR